MITIYNFSGGARGLRPMWLCEEMGLTYKFVPITYPPPQEYLARFSLGSVPFLEDGGGVAISESAAMLFYLAGRYGPTPFLPALASPDYARCIQMAEFGEATLGALINTLLTAKFGGPKDEQGVWLVKFTEERCKKAIDFVAGMLGQHNYIIGNAPTIADISIVTALMIWRGAWKGEVPPPLGDYIDRLSARPACLRAQATMKT